MCSSDLVWPYVVGGAGVASLVVSVVFGLDSVSAGSDLDNVCGAERTSCPASYDFESVRGEELRGFGLFVGFGVVGLAATTAGALGLVLHGDSAAKQTAIVPWASPDGAGLVVRGATF